MHYLQQLLLQQGEAWIWDYTLGMRIDKGLCLVFLSPKIMLESEDMSNMEGPMLSILGYEAKAYIFHVCTRVIYWKLHTGNFHNIPY